MREFETCGSVLYVAAHPDDENTQLITYLARGRALRTAYLSLTRGDGGQNVLGPEFGDKLGAIRTQELLAARRVDGGRQFFSRARDFGYSKDYRQTLTKWDRQQVLADIVRVIRRFRPDVVITRFSPEPGGTHGHHTASAALALEAFALAGDPKAFADQLGGLAPWQPKRLLWNNFGSAGAADQAIHLAIDGTDQATGVSFATLAARSRSMHQTQGFANFSVAAAGSGPRMESFVTLAGDPATGDIMDGVDVTWARVPGGAAIGRAAAALIAGFDPKNPAASVPALLGLRSLMDAVGDDPLVQEKRLRLDSLLQACLGLSVTTAVPENEVVAGQILDLRHVALVTSDVPVVWKGVRYPGLGADTQLSRALVPSVPAVVEVRRRLPPSTPVSQPYWLRLEPTPGMFRVADATLIGIPENPPVVPVEDVFEVGGQTLVVRDEAARLLVAPGRPEARRRLNVVAPVSLGVGQTVALFSPGSTRSLSVSVDAAIAGVSGSVDLEVPQGWSVSPAARSFRFEKRGEHASFDFAVTAPRAAASGPIEVRATVGGQRISTGRLSIDYGHIEPLLLQPDARIQAVSLDMAIRGKVVGYLAGAGDSVAASLEQMGYKVVALRSEDLTQAVLAPLDAVVVGVRAFNTVKDLPAHLPALYAYAQAGGTVVEQYNTPGGLVGPELAPYALSLSRDLPRHRVTDEKSAVTLLLPGHPALSGPNRITAGDFDGWVQERGLNFPSEWDKAHLDALIACGDPGEPALTSGLLVGRYGKGWFVYTGLSFFRQLPAGVPGAYRLFANLVSLGK